MGRFLIVLACAALAFAADPWKDNTTSPWARSVSADMGFSRMRGGGMGGGGMRGGAGGGGGMGDRGGVPKFVVRWERAAPVRDTAAKTEDPDASRIAELAQEYYVVSVSGNRMTGGAPARMQQMQERMAQAITLKRKGKDPIAPTKVGMLRAEKGMLTVFLFRRSQAISAEDVEFETSMGPMKVKSKFALKDMQYQGKLAL